MQKNTRTVLFLTPYPHGEAPSQRFRFEQYLDDLTAAGFRVEAQAFLTKDAWRIWYRSGNFAAKAWFLLVGFWRRLWVLFRSVPGASFVFIHREAAPVGPPVLEWMIARVFGKKIIYDFDDSIWLSNTSEENRIVSRLKWHSKVSSICRWSYRVSAGNKYLAAYASAYAPSVVVNPTTVDADRVHVPAVRASPSDKTITIGWTGTHSTLKYLEGLAPVLLRLEETFGSEIRLLVIADRPANLTLKNMTFQPWSKEKEIDDLQQIDIGVMPLADDAWAQGKCGLKALQYMSLGIATIASPVGVNKEIVVDGEHGYLCDTPNAWFNRLSELIRSREKRKELGEAGRKRVLAAYSTTSNRSVFLSLFR